MKHNSIYSFVYKFLFCCILVVSGGVVASAAPVATVTADIQNDAPGRHETAWGRLVSDALRSAGKAELALVNAGSLNAGVLKAGPVSQSQIDALLSFPSDEVVVLPLSGAALRSAVELSLRAYPTGSPAFLQGSGWEGLYNPEARPGERLISLKINGRDLVLNSTYQVAMPISLAQGTNGYFAYWNDSSARSLRTSIATVVANYLSDQQPVSPSNTVRMKPQK